jgi:hypothetical protein
MPSRQPAENHRIHEVFQQAVAHNQQKLTENQIDARFGEYQGCPFLKLDKASWHNRGEVAIPGEIFFSIWLDEKGRLNYNIHALKLRHLTKFKLQSREFAKDFRAQLILNDHDWPNLSLDFGPLTLMQGWVEHESQFEGLVTKFIAIHPIIDELLEEQKK